MVAPRALACSSSSRMTMPPPSPMTKPSRVASKGRDAVSGESFRSDNAFMFAKPPMAIGVRARRAGRDRRVVRSLRVEPHRHQAGGDVGDEHRDEERADLALPALAVDVVLLLERLEAANTAAD